MSARPWMPMYWGDYIADTAHLSNAEHGAYLLLIAHYWQNEGLPDGDARLARIVRLTMTQWKKIKPTIHEFFFDGWKHKRIEFELTESRRISDAGRRGGIASGEARRQAKYKQNQSQNSTTVERPLNDQRTISEALQLQLQRKIIPADAGADVSCETATPSPVESPKAATGKYIFDGGIIKINGENFDKWTQAFRNLDLRSELTARDAWLGSDRATDKDRRNWFISTAKYLANRNSEARTKSGGFVWRSGIEGVV